MQGIQGLRVDAGKYFGEISIMAAEPQVHMILSSDTLFLDRACWILEQERRHLVFDHPGGRVSFLQKQDNLVDGLTVAENLFLQTHKGFFLSCKKMVETCERMVEEIGYYLPPHTQVSELSVSQRRFVEFYRVYLRAPDLLIANEVTTSLSYKEILYFNRILERLKMRGTAIFLFSTRCEEAMRIGDQVHVYVNGESKAVLSKQQVQASPESLLLLMMDVDPQKPGEGEIDERQWLKAISDSMRIEDQLTRINQVLEAYCERIRKLMNGEFCRLYLYQDGGEDVSCIAGSEGASAGYGCMKAQEIRIIGQGESFFVANGREPGYEDLFETAQHPRGTICYHVRVDRESRLLFQIGLDTLPRYIKDDQMDRLRYMAIELLIFMENSRLHRQAVILQESNHRVKNNMQMILSYLTLQQQSLYQKMSSPEDRESVTQAFRDLTNRILAVYNVHNLISRWGRHEEAAGFRDLLHEIERVYQDYMEVALYMDAMEFPQKQLLPLCIVLNEMMNNSVKHNTGLGRKLQVRIKIETQGREVRLTYRDDGTGQRKTDHQPPPGIGMRLISMIVQSDLKGSVETDVGEGFEVRVRFPTD